ncbi:MAG: DNA helicase PcrA [Bilifractor sp.]|jgi:DNA helicase-2/ATP-dependent DNA helicase PcrA
MNDLLSSLNAPQREAVLTTEGPLLILAGAGSGKTRTLTCRVAYLISEKQVSPWNIMAITFTNKAAGEMRERVDQLVKAGSESIWISTFHSTCCRILRRYIHLLGYENNFTIYDTDDSRQVMKEVIRLLELDPKVYKEKNILSRISSAKNEMTGPEEFEKNASSWIEKQYAKCYFAYQKRLKENNALDFDDLLVMTVELFRQEPDVLSYYQEKFRYIMIDEYQDTNTVQFLFVKLLASRYRNLCVVGDDDQSIYKFRGANIRNILNFEKEYPGAKVIRLEQNYRSTQNILNAANEVIAHNIGRKKKKLWTENGEGSKIHFREFDDGYQEAEYIARDIGSKCADGKMAYHDFAVLYRTNAMSRIFEEKFIARNIPYKIVGAINFYARREIKDLLSYLKTVDNGSDDLAVERIINIPKRGIGQTSIGKVEQYALEKNIGFYDALLEVDRIPGMSRAAGKIRGFTNLIEKYRSLNADGYSVREILELIIGETGYVAELEAQNDDEARARIENINELISKTEDYMDTAESPSLSDFLQQVSLVADIDSVEEDSDYVLLMTLHSAKGLEFDNVYMAGMEENTFPSYMSISEHDTEEMEEERRLCYVGITRARKDLTMTAVHMRMVRGEPQFLKASRFVREIPREYIELERETTDTRNFMDRPKLSFDDIMGMGRQEKGAFGSGYGTSGAGVSRSGYGSSGAGYSASGAEKNRFGASGYGSSGYRNPSAARPDGKNAKGRFRLEEFRVSKPDHLDYQTGDKVRHVKFGVGTVKEIKDGARDYEVTVDFENFGIKRMFASFAKLKKV